MDGRMVEWPAGRGIAKCVAASKVQPLKLLLVMEGVMEVVGGKILSGILAALKGLLKS
jgi:hypothetical protein